MVLAAGKPAGAAAECRAVLAREWARSLGGSTCAPTQPTDVGCLHDFLQLLETALTDPGVEPELKAGERWFDELFTSAAVGIAISATDGRIVRTNPALDQFLGSPPGDLVGSRLSDLFLPEERAGLQQYYQRSLAGTERRLRTKVLLRGQDGEQLWTQLTVSVLPETASAPRYHLTMFGDITELHLLKERLKHQTLHDVQTGLPNRQYFVSHLEEVLGLHDPSAVVTLAHLDLDGFSVINEGLGHHCGDQLLDVVGQRLRRVVVGQRAMVARIGNDEYAILIEPGPATPDVTALTEAVNTELAAPFRLSQTEVSLTATIGVVQQRVAETQPADLLRDAAATLHRLRGTGTRQWATFDPGLDTAHRTELRLAAAFPTALETGELQVGYQPVGALDDGRVIGVEAVLTWQHPTLGALPHDQCLRLAEQTGAIHALGRWLLHTTAEHTASWHRHPGSTPPPPVSINLTASQIQDPDLIAMVTTVLERTGLPPGGLELRAPAGAVGPGRAPAHGRPAGEADDNLRVLADLGIRTGLHEFAGDVRTLSCLDEPWVHTIRIAQPVARQVRDNPGAVLAQALRGLISTLRPTGISVVAGAVDTRKAAAWWREAGADCGTGALFGPPSPPQGLKRLTAHLPTSRE